MFLRISGFLYVSICVYTWVLCLLVHDILNLDATLPYLMHNQPLYVSMQEFLWIISLVQSKCFYVFLASRMFSTCIYTLVLSLLVLDILNLHATLPYLTHNQPLYVSMQEFLWIILLVQTKCFYIFLASRMWVYVYVWYERGNSYIEFQRLVMFE